MAWWSLREAGYFDRMELALVQEFADLGLEMIDKRHRIEQLACHDIVTGLPNPRLYQAHGPGRRPVRLRGSHHRRRRHLRRDPRLAESADARVMIQGSVGIAAVLALAVIAGGETERGLEDPAGARLRRRAARLPLRP